MMPERCLMLRPHTQTSSPLAGRGAGTPCMISCRVPLTPREESCPSPCHCLSCTSTQEEEMETTLRTARARPLHPTERQSRGTANLSHSLADGQSIAWEIPAGIVVNQFTQSGLIVGG